MKRKMVICTKKDAEAVVSSAEDNSKLFQALHLDEGNFVCVGGRPGMGKTALVLHLALEYAQKSAKAVYMISEELSANQLYDRMIVSLSEVDFCAYMEKTLSPAEKARIERAQEQLSKLNIIIDDDADFLTAEKIEEKIKQRENLGLVIVDGVRLLSSSKEKNDQNSNYDEIERQFKRLRKYKNIPIIFTAHLSRRVEYRKDKRPHLSDLKRAGAFKYMDTVCFIYREGYYEPFSECEKVEIIISKSANGGCGMISLAWQGECMRFKE